MSQKTLTTYLCEKPSQALDVAKFLGLFAAHKRKNHWIDKKRGVAVIHAVGHLFALEKPEFYTPELAKGNWRAQYLPVLPSEFQLSLKEDMKALFSTIKGILKNTSCLVIATDCDDEGELIARDIIAKSGFKGEVKRALYSATDRQSLEEAFSCLRDGRETEFMAERAALRRKLDWLLGLNGTMAFTSKLKAENKLKKGSFPVGRVVTAACMIVHSIEEEIKAFKPTKYFNVDVSFGGATGQVVIPDDYLDSEGRCLSKGVADTLSKTVIGADFVVTEVEEKIEKQSPPPLFDLAALQIEADKFGIEADETLTLLQRLYDQPLSCVTYPRTDKRYLPTSMYGDAMKILNNLNNFERFKAFDYQFEVMPAAFNDEKVDVHHAIIPSSKGVHPRKLTEKQLVIYLLVSLRYAQQFMPKREVKVTNVTLAAGKLRIVAKSRKVVVSGWGEADLKNKKDSDVQILNFELGQRVKVDNASVREGITKPPSRLTSGKLVEAMNNPAKYETDPTIRAMLKEGDGIGTSATQAGIIQGALQRGGIVKAGKVFKPSKVFSENAGEMKLLSPGFTALLQRSIKAVGDGSLTEDAVMEQNKGVVKKMVATWAK